MSFYTLKTVLTPESAIIAADYLVERFCEKANNETVDYDYQIEKGKMVDTGDANTTYRFDTDENTLLRQVVDIMAKMDDMSQEEIDIESNWKESVIKYINENYIDKIRDVLRSSVFKNIQPELVPMKPFELIDLDINPKPEVDFLIVIQRMVPKDQVGQSQNKEPGQKAINQDLLETHIKTGLPLDEIIAKKKAEGDSRYASVYGAYKRKYLYDIEMLFFVDYSLTPQEEFLRLMQAKK